MDCRSWCDVAVARADTLQRGSYLEDCLGDPDHFASNNGKRILVAGARATRSPTPFAARRDCLPLYSLRCLQRARHYPDIRASFDLSGLPIPGRSIGNPQHDPRQLGPDE